MLEKLKWYLPLFIILIIILSIPFAIYQEVSFINRCNKNNGIYKIGRMSLCLSKDGRIIETL